MQCNVEFIYSVSVVGEIVSGIKTFLTNTETSMYSAYKAIDVIRVVLQHPEN